MCGLSILLNTALQAITIINRGWHQRWSLPAVPAPGWGGREMWGGHESHGGDPAEILLIGRGGHHNRSATAACYVSGNRIWGSGAATALFLSLFETWIKIEPGPQGYNELCGSLKTVFILDRTRGIIRCTFLEFCRQRRFSVTHYPSEFAASSWVLLKLHSQPFLEASCQNRGREWRPICKWPKSSSKIRSRASLPGRNGSQRAAFSLLFIKESRPWLR